MSKLTISNLEESVVAQSNLTELSAEETTNVVGGFVFVNVADDDIEIGIQGVAVKSLGIGDLDLD